MVCAHLAASCVKKTPRGRATAALTMCLESMLMQVIEVRLPHPPAPPEVPPPPEAPPSASPQNTHTDQPLPPSEEPQTFGQTVAEQKQGGATSSQTPSAVVGAGESGTGRELSPKTLLSTASTAADFNGGHAAKETRCGGKNPGESSRRDDGAAEASETASRSPGLGASVPGAESALMTAASSAQAAAQASSKLVQESERVLMSVLANVEDVDGMDGSSRCYTRDLSGAAASGEGVASSTVVTGHKRTHEDISQG